MEFKFESLAQMISCQNRDFQVSAVIFRGKITSTNISGFLPSTVSRFIADFESKKTNTGTIDTEKTQADSLLRRLVYPETIYVQQYGRVKVDVLRHVDTQT